ncbi:MAG: GNAT family N-acetyltransferase [Candidatus Competibacteraceae bacterium]|nr:GNAT family N-acetyltransferase [Candidatus Competibacteraceae bacterium]MBK7985010.1 GNAT family N-acetyltransferase [Candidatus Competibacteraceae bacterium]MBK8895911.1 GNAT family N-acetyltransferase [Candidatus Competibacteraceae bacterium]MBK8963002.1 GNAT family N-acetyltransferase [Candidatus Competibacteraceae bacterium]MBK9953063.1 GNAT family N-acetyltransferase [Candidatus Competibacteraceae bacterium]
MEIQIASKESEIVACFLIVRELRPHLTQSEFLAQVRRQMQNHGYVLVALAAREEIVAAAGYRIAEFLAWGRVFYVDDLICRSAFRKHGYGGQLLDWLLDRAKEAGCTQFHLDSGAHRHDAHRLYLSRKLQISSHHFSKELSDRAV